MLRELYLEAESMQVNEDGESDSNGSSSSDTEEEKITETDKIKKALEELQTSLEKTMTTTPVTVNYVITEVASTTESSVGRLK